MTSDTRRSLALLLIGLAATIVALTVGTTALRDACLDAGGRWLAERRCEIASGASGAPPTATRAYLLGGLAGAVAAVVLWRTFSFYATRARRPGAERAKP